MAMTLTAVFQEVPKSEGGGYFAFAEELPGAVSEGDTLAEARENLRDAIAILLEANRDLANKPRQGKTVKRERLRVMVRKAASR